MRSIVLRFDMRSAPFCPDPGAGRYRACVEMAAMADRLPVDVIGLSEHHVSPDGYLSSPLILASQIAGRTNRVMISVSALLVPLHDPLRLADEPERAWQTLGPYLLFDAEAYGEWRHPNRRAYAESFAGSLEELRAEGKYRILTPAQALQQLEQTASLHLAPLCGGLPLEAAWRCMQLFAEEVVPALG